jgi:hypothetical protein
LTFHGRVPISPLIPYNIKFVERAAFEKSIALFGQEFIVFQKPSQHSLQWQEQAYLQTEVILESKTAERSEVFTAVRICSGLWSRVHSPVHANVSKKNRIWSKYNFQ